MNKIVQERYCSPKVARLLASKGFDIICDKVYGDKDEYLQPIEFRANLEGKGFIPAPTQQMAIDWLIVKYDIYIEVFPYSKDEYAFSISKLLPEDVEGYPLPNEEESYKDIRVATDTALEYVLENLIEV